MIELLKTLATKLVPWFIGEIADLAEKGIKGEDVSHHWVMEKIGDDKLKTEVLDDVKTAARKEAGLPT